MEYYSSIDIISSYHTTYHLPPPFSQHFEYPSSKRQAEAPQAAEFTHCWTLLRLVAVDFSRTASYKTDVAKLYAPKIQASNGKLKHQKWQNLHNAKHFTAWWRLTFLESAINVFQKNEKWKANFMQWFIHSSIYEETSRWHCPLNCRNATAFMVVSYNTSASPGVLAALINRNDVTSKLAI